MGQAHLAILGLLMAGCSDRSLSTKGDGDVVEREPGLEVAPSLLDLGVGDEGCPRSGVFHLISVGDAPVTIESLDLADSGFSVRGPDLPLTLDPGDYTEVRVTWAPVQGAATGTLRVQSEVGEVLGAIQAEGHAPLFGVLPGSLDLGATKLSCEAHGTVSVWNGSRCPRTVTAIELAEAPFFLDPDLPHTLAPYESLEVPVRFVPSEVGPADAQIVAKTDTTQAKAALTGSGVSIRHTEAFEAFPRATEPIYVHSGVFLQSWDPAEPTVLNDVVRMDRGFYDIAMDDYGSLFGVLSDGIYEVDPSSGRSRLIRKFSGKISGASNALAFLDDGRMWGAGKHTAWEVDLRTGKVTDLLVVDAFSAGDLVQIDDRVYWSVDPRQIVVMDANTGEQVDALSVDVPSSIWGLAAPGGNLYTFGSGGEIRHIDPTDGSTLAKWDDLTWGFTGADDNVAHAGGGAWIFRLARQPSPENVVVTVDGVPRTDFTVDDEAWLLRFTTADALSGGEVVEISYDEGAPCE